ncbi:MAG: Ig-like domain-containing protein [Planctomycetota bacterium]|nr:Ig-like domain-containing protein [Planctomycetota bacterium]
MTINYFINLQSEGVGTLTHVGRSIKPIDPNNYLDVSVGAGVTEATIVRGVEAWNLACGVKFVRVFNHTQAQIKIGEETLAGSTVGLGGFTASSQGQGFFITAGFVQLDQEVAGSWTVNFLLTVTAHEIGHAIGLQHTNVAALMFPSVGAIVGPIGDEQWWTQAGLYGRALPVIDGAVDNQGQVTLTLRRVAPQMTGTNSDETFQGSAPAPTGPGVGTGSLTMNNVTRYELERGTSAGGPFTPIQTNIQAPTTNNSNPQQSLANNQFTTVDMTVPSSGTYFYRYRAVFQNSGADPKYSDPFQVAVTVVDADRPTAVNDSYDATEDTLLTVAAGSGVLSNDTDGAQATDLDAILVSDVSNGTLNLDAETGAFTYMPDQDFFGTDTFTYFAQNSLATPQMSMLATVTINVAGVNDPPVAGNWFMQTQENGAVSDNLSNALTDVDGAAPTFTRLTNAANGNVALNTATGSFTYTPNPGFNGADSFTWRANDTVANSNTGTVSLMVSPVNDNPVAIISDPSGMITVPVNTSVDFEGAGSSDVDGALTNFRWDFADGTFTDVPFGASNTGQTSHTFLTPGSYAVTLVVTDDEQGMSDPATVIVEVTGGADDTALVVTRGSFTRSHTKVNADSFLAMGNINPGLMPTSLAGLNATLFVNGVQVGPTGILDAAGRATSTAIPGGRFSFANSRGGRFMVSITKADLTGALGLDNETSTFNLPVSVNVVLTRAAPAFNLDLTGQPEFAVTSRLNSTARGSFSFARNRLLTGAFFPTRISVRENPANRGGGFNVSLSGMLTPGGGGPFNVFAAGDGVDLTIDGDNYPRRRGRPAEQQRDDLQDQGHRSGRGHHADVPQLQQELRAQYPRPARDRHPPRRRRHRVQLHRADRRGGRRQRVRDLRDAGLHRALPVHFHLVERAVVRVRIF